MEVTGSTFNVTSERAVCRLWVKGGGGGGHLLVVVLKSITCGLIDLLLCSAEQQSCVRTNFISRYVKGN